MKKKILLGANIICGTLNSFGSDSIKEILIDRTPGQVKSKFTCCIIDEVGQFLSAIL